MRIFRSLEEVPADFGPTILSVGNFDGIHCGHLSVLKEVTERARQNHSKAMAVTFEPHPFRILRPDVTPRLITPLAKKEALLAQTGLDALLEITFTRDFSMTTPEEFARDILAGKLHAKEVHEGDNFHFGHNAQGNTASLKELGKQFGFEVRDHLDLGIEHGWIDMEKAAAASGARFAYLLGDLVMVELALIRLAVDTVRAEGFEPVVPPVLVRE